MDKYLKKTADIIFGLLAFVFIIIASLGINIDFNRLTTTAFWLETGLKWVLTIVIYNATFEYDTQTRIHDKQSRFYLAFSTLKTRTKLIHNHKLYNTLDNAIKQKNQQLLEELWTYKLHKICTNLSYSDIYDNTKTVEEIAEEIRLHNKYKIKRLSHLMSLIRSGATPRHYKPLKEDYFLKDNELAKISINRFDYDSSKQFFKRNSDKTLLFLITSMLTAIITYSFYAPNFWATLVANLITLFFSIVAGFKASIKDIKLRTNVYENRNDFLERYCGIQATTQEPDKFEAVQFATIPHVQPKKPDNTRPDNTILSDIISTDTQAKQENTNNTHENAHNCTTPHAIVLYDK